jgi:hypothetical protein
MRLLARRRAPFPFNAPARIGDDSRGRFGDCGFGDCGFGEKR